MSKHVNVYVFAATVTWLLVILFEIEMFFETEETQNFATHQHQVGGYCSVCMFEPKESGQRKGTNKKRRVDEWVATTPCH